MGTPTTNLRIHKPPWTSAGSEVTAFATGLDHIDVQSAHVVNVMGFWDSTAGAWKACTRDGATVTDAELNVAVGQAAGANALLAQMTDSEK